MTRFPLPVLTTLALVAQLALAPASAQAQGMAVGFGGLSQDSSTPVEVTADTLRVERETGAATFEGNVLVVQGALRLSAARVAVDYGADGEGVRRIRATGGVTLATATDAAESREATYDVATGALVMTGSVLLTQGPATIAGEKLTADLRSGTGQMEGRVRTVFQPGTKGGN